MNTILAVPSFFLGVALGFLGVAMSANTALIFAGIFGFLAFIGFCTYGFMALVKRIWPGRERWFASSSYEMKSLNSDPQNAINKDKRKVWRSSSPQKSNHWFMVDLGKERMISRIELEPEQGWNEKPKKWYAQFFGTNPNVTISRPINGEGFIVIEEQDLPERLKTFTIYITEAAEDKPEGSNYVDRYGAKVFWSISYVRITEYLFSIRGRRFWRHEL